MKPITFLYSHLYQSLAILVALTACTWRGDAADLLVSNTSDSGPGSLREAIAENQNLGGGHTIIFSNTAFGTITLTSGELLVETNVTILGPGPSVLSVDGNFSSRVFRFHNVTANLSGLKVAHGTEFQEGGGIANEAGSLTVSNCNILFNSSFSHGGGLFNGGTLTMNNCSLNGNASDGPFEGGAIFSQGALALTGCTFLHNSAFEGGAVRSAGSLLAVTNCTFATNSAEIGGACSVANGSPGAVFIQVTIVGNSAINDITYGGGGLFLYNKAATLANSIIAGNSCPLGPDISVAGSSGVTTLGVNWVGDLADSGLTAGPTLLTGNPLLLPLGNYGGPTSTMPPSPGSPVIDAGSDVIASALATDQRGLPRLSGTHVDLGAVEIASNPGVILNPVRLGNGAFWFSITNLSGPASNYVVWASTNVTAPFNVWSNLGLAIESPPGQFQFTDLQATNYLQRFYRVTTP